uniref:Reverse transcriptase domain-containing protein n=1 Tax=Leptobrachium leishanense TaxID=445787 RepID=A0A8C5M2P2_9ANUR
MAAYRDKPLSLLSYNVRGLNTPEKRRQILRELRALRASVIFIQETHFRGDSTLTLADRNFPLGFYSNYTGGKSRGSAIIFAADVPFVETETRRDEEGRFLFTKGMIAGKLYTFASVYLPNKSQCRCLSGILRKLAAFREGLLVLAGDFNVPLDPRLDTSSGVSSIPDSMHRQMRRLLDSYQLVDVWRAFHGRERDFSFYSAAHSSYSRLDYFFMSPHELTLVRDSAIAVRTWSDHAAVSVSISSPLCVPKERNWRLNISLLSDPQVLLDAQTLLSNFFQDNVTPDVPLPTIWEAHKACIRGFFISRGTAFKNRNKAHFQVLLADVQRLQDEHIASGADETFQRLLQARQSLADHLNADLKLQAIKSRAFFALHENKPGRLLAQQLRARRQRAYIPRVRISASEITSHPARIAAEFRKFFQALYNIRSDDELARETSLTRQYLDRTVSHTLSRAESETMSLPITMEELMEAIRMAKNNKSPGPDGFPSEYYKSFRDTLAPHWLATFNAVTEGARLHQATLAASISLLPKPEKDPLLCASYRPISLLNCDLKLLTRILATRLRNCLPRLIDSDQVGFIPGREARDATTRVIDAISLAHRGSSPVLLLSTDAEKAFDRVLWPFMRMTLAKFGFDATFLSWIDAIYDTPTARVRVNGALTDSFQVRNGTRQGCPLSPLLFALTLEPLLSSIRLNPLITGIRGHSLHHKVSAYADDLLFMLSNPEVSLREVVKELDNYGALSGFKINMNKSEILNISLQGTNRAALGRRFPFRWCAEKLRYLGIWLHADVSKIPSLNFLPILSVIHQDMRGWSSKYLSWLGRVGVLKMNVLPRLLYLVQTIPLRVPRGWLAEVRKLFLNFVWAGKRPRLKFTTMCKPVSSGGLALPDLGLYLFANHLTRLLDWMEQGSTRRWLDLEWALAECPLWALPWLLQRNVPLPSRRAPTVGCTLRYWLRARPLFALSPSPSPLLPLSHNPALLGGVSAAVRLRFTTSSCLRAHHLFADGQWIPLGGGETPAPTFAESFNYAQLRSFLCSLPDRSGLLRQLTQFEKYCVMGIALTRSLSTLYSMLQAFSAELPSFVGRWDNMLGDNLPEKHWTKTFYFIASGSPVSRFRETSYKLISLWYTSPAQTARFCASAEDVCWRCNLVRGTYLHMWWSCSRIRPFWGAIQKLVHHVMSLELALDPRLFLLGQTDLPYKSFKRSILPRLLLAARSVPPLFWKSDLVPPLREVLLRMELIRSAEQLLYPADKWDEIFRRSWYYWLEFVSSSKCTEWLREAHASE